MSSTQVRSETAIETPRARTVDMKLEVVVIPVSDVDRAKRFYSNLGWRLDADFAAGDDWRVIQFTPPGSGCSVIFGKNVTAAAPGSAQGLYLVVSDIKDARDELLRRGVGISEVFHDAGDVHAGADGPTCSGGSGLAVRIPTTAATARTPRSAIRTATAGCCRKSPCDCPDGWTRTHTTFTSSTELATALRRAATAHGEHEKRTGQHDADWPDWYAEYIVREQAGKELPS